MLNKLLIFILTVCAFCQISFAQTTSSQSILDSVVTIYSIVDGRETAVGSGIVVGADGYILTPLHLVKDISRISVKFRSGEIFDNAKIAGKDERRNVALLHITAVGLNVLPIIAAEEPIAGARISVISNSSGANLSNQEAVLSSSQMADGIGGAGSGYRLYLFETRAGGNSVGGILSDERGRPFGIITTNPNMRQQNIAVPLSSISGLTTFAKDETAPPVQPKSAAPVVQNFPEIRQNLPTETNVKTEAAKFTRKMTAYDVLHSAKTIYVRSRTSFIQDEAFIAELMENTDFKEWGWSFTNDRSTADLILEVDRLPWVIKFTYKIYSLKHGVIIASGNKHTNDLDYGSPDLVRAIIKKVKVEWATVR